MSHLTHDELVDALGGALTPERTRHLSQCPSCADELHERQRVLREVSGVDVPEPSPLFWEQFPAQVGRRLDVPDRRAASWWSPAIGWALTAALLVISLLGISMLRSTPSPRPPAQSGGTDTVTRPEPAATATLVALDTSDLDGDEAWAVVRSLATDLDYDAVTDAGMAPVDGAVEHAAAALSATERAELARLLEDEMKRTGA